MKKSILITIFSIILLGVGISAVESNIFLGDYQVKYNYEGAEEGERFTLNVEITNTGSAKADVVFELDDSKPFDLQTDETWEIGSLAKDAKVTRTFRVEVAEDTPEDEYDLQFTLEDNKDDYEDEFEIQTTFENAELIIADVKSEPPIISADQEDIKLTLKVDNIGTGDANSIVAKLELPQGFSPSSSFSDTANAGVVKAKESTDMVFFIDTEKAIGSGTYQGTLSIRYETENELETKNLQFDLPLKGRPIYTITSSRTIPSAVTVAGSGKLQVVVQNIGEELGEETSVRVFENADLPIEFDQKTNLIGSIFPGREGTASFDFTVEEDASAKVYLVKAQVRTVSRGNVIVNEHTIPVTIIEQERGAYFGWMLAIALIILLGIIIYLFVIIRKKR